MRAASDLAALRGLPAPEIRMLCRAGEFSGETVSVPPVCGYAVANLVALPRALALDFLIYAQRNPQACPVLAVTEPGKPVLGELAPGADLRTDLPRYRVYAHGALVAEVADVRSYWRDDVVGILLGCSCTVDQELRRRGVPIRDEAAGRDALFVTNRQTVPGGIFNGPLVVSVRPVPAPLVDTVAQVTARFPRCHGAPVHVGDPGALGIADLGKPDWGHPLRLADDEVPVFHACGVTPQTAALEARAELMITHAPSHMLVLDVAPEALMLRLPGDPLGPDSCR